MFSKWCLSKFEGKCITLKFKKGIFTHLYKECLTNSQHSFQSIFTWYWDIWTAHSECWCSKPAADLSWMPGTGGDETSHRNLKSAFSSLFQAPQSSWECCPSAAFWLQTHSASGLDLESVTFDKNKSFALNT